MSTFFERYIEKVNYAIALENAEFEAEFAKLDAMYEMANLQLAAMKADAKIKVITESGNDSDLDFLYTEAENEVKEQKEGFIKRIIEAIKGIFKAIGNGFKRIFNISSDDNTMVEISKQNYDNANILVKSANEVKDGISKCKNGDFSGALQVLKVVAIPAIVITGATVAVKKKDKIKDGIQKTVKDLKDLAQKLQDAYKGVDSEFSSAEGKLNDESTDADNKKGVLNKVREFLNRLKRMGDVIWDAITSGLKKNKDGENNDSSNDDTPENEGEENKDEENKDTSDDSKPENDGEGKKDDSNSDNKSKKKKIRYKNDAGEVFKRKKDGTWWKKNSNGMFEEFDGKPSGNLTKYEVDENGNEVKVESSYDYDDFNENEYISESQSIFGYDESDEYYGESGFDAEISQLANLFEKL